MDSNLKLRWEPSSMEMIRELQKAIVWKNWRKVVFCGFWEPLEKLDCLLKVASKRLGVGDTATSAHGMVTNNKTGLLGLSTR